MLNRLQWELVRPSPAHGVSDVRQSVRICEDLLDLVLAGFVCCYPCFKILALLFLLCFENLPMVGNLHLKVILILLSQTTAPKVLKITKDNIKSYHLDLFIAL